jgi:uncharacterized membrane protein (UPF0127 family)
MKKRSSQTLQTREDKDYPNNFDSATSEKNYPNNSYQSFNTTHVDEVSGSSISEPIGYEDATISPVDSDDITTPLPKESALKIFKKMAKSNTWSSIATFNVDIDSSDIQKYSSNKDSGLKKDLRISSIDKKYDLFYFDFSNIKTADLNYCLNNSLISSKPICAGFIEGISNEHMPILESFGFKKSLSVKYGSVFYLRKNDLSKISNVQIFNEKEHRVCEFLCDVAHTMSDKIAGLQPYKNLKYGSGLLFPYKEAQDVLYHMGTVSFPIDIIFVGANGKIKKIEKQIAPGSLATFGSSNISMVLEIAGGSSDLLGIKVGNSLKAFQPSDSVVDNYNKIQDSFSGSKNLFIRNAFYNSKSSYDNFDIYSLNSNNISPSFFIKSASSFKTENKELVVYNFDSIISDGLGFFNDKNLGKISISTLSKEKDINGLFLSKSSSLSNFLAKNSLTPPEVRTAFFDIKKSLNNKKKVVIATSIDCKPNIFKTLILKRASEELVLPDEFHSIEILSAPKDCMSDYDSMLEKYNCSSIIYKNVILDKYAGMPIPDEIKEKARKANEILTDSKEKLEEIKDSFKKNSDAYTKMKDKPDVVSGSKNAFQLSCKRISKKIVAFLLGVKKLIKIMNEIKDISSVDEKIEAVSLSCKEFVETAEDIFGMVSKISEMTFVGEFVAESTKIEKSIEDVENNLENFSDYILKNILNKKVLSR